MIASPKPKDLRLSITIRYIDGKPKYSVQWTGEPEEFAQLQLSRQFRIILQALAG